MEFSTSKTRRVIKSWYIREDGRSSGGLAASAPKIPSRRDNVDVYRYLTYASAAVRTPCGCVDLSISITRDTHVRAHTTWMNSGKMYMIKKINRAQFILLYIFKASRKDACKPSILFGVTITFILFLKLKRNIQKSSIAKLQLYL